MLNKNHYLYKINNASFLILILVHLVFTKVYINQILFNKLKINYKNKLIGKIDFI